MRCSSSEDQMERQNIKKFQGDLLYQRHQYKEALCMYQESQQYLSPNNSVLARELTESMAMCLLKLEKFEDALKLVGEIQVSVDYTRMSRKFLFSHSILTSNTKCLVKSKYSVYDTYFQQYGKDNG